VKTEDARGGTFIETGDRVRLFYQDWGAGKPIVFVHAAGMTSDQWQYNVADFSASGYRCVSFDRRGHGRSDRPRHGYVFERLADDVADVIEALDLREVTLVGYSLGAIEAVGYLARHGTGRVARLVLLAPCTPFVSKTADNPDGVDPPPWKLSSRSGERTTPRGFTRESAPSIVPRYSASARASSIGRST
jgi:non-heme chloroperoxidase